MIEPFHVAILIFVIAPAVILGAAAFTAALTDKRNDEQ